MTDFNIRLNDILAHFELTPSQFADLTGIQRSNFSHIISERNKPSLDFVLKIIETFPTLNLYWLLLGKGSMFQQKSTTEETISALPPTASEPQKETIETEKHTQEFIAAEESRPVENVKEIHAPDIDLPSESAKYGNLSSPVSNDAPEEIILFYKDGTFKSFRSR